MKQFLGILFFYTVTYFIGRDEDLKANPHRLGYLKEKSLRYLNKDITLAEWELLKIYLKDVPTPNTEDKDFLSIQDLCTLVEAFDKVYGIDTIDNIISLGEMDEEHEKNLWLQIYKDLPGFVSIVGSSNGVSITLARWLEKMEYNKDLIERELSFIELGI